MTKEEKEKLEGEIESLRIQMYDSEHIGLNSIHKPEYFQKEIEALRAQLPPMTQEDIRKAIKKMIAKIHRYESQVSYEWYVTTANKPENLRKELLELARQLSMTKEEIQKEIESLRLQLVESEAKTFVGREVPTEKHPIVLRGEIDILTQLSNTNHETV